MSFRYRDYYIDTSEYSTLTAQESRRAEIDKLMQAKSQKLSAIRLQSQPKWARGNGRGDGLLLESRQDEEEGKECYVYFLFDPDRNLVKIGTSSQLPERLEKLKLDYPGARLYGKIEGTYKEEKELHKMFDDFRVEGEWFKLNYPILLYLKYFAILPLRLKDKIETLLDTTEGLSRLRYVGNHY